MTQFRDWFDFAFYAPFSILRHIWIQLVLLSGMFGAGTLIFMRYQGLDPLTAFLGSVSTITTIGIYAPNIQIMPNIEKALLVIVFIVSVGSAASLVQGTVAATVKKELLTEELAKRKAHRMKNHIIVMGYDFLGKYVVNGLKNIKAEFIVVAKEGVNVDPLKSEGLPVINAPVTHLTESLKLAGIDRASALISTFENDGDNMLSVMTAKKLNPKIRTITIVNDKEVVDAAKGVGADVVIPVQELMGQVLAMSSISKEIAGVFLTENLRSRHVAEFEVTNSGAKYGCMNKIAPILMVSRNGNVIVDFDDNFELMKGDLVYVLTDHSSLADFREALSSVAAQNT
jgi:voltage-gated potassium channel